MSSDYEAHVRATVPKLTCLLATTFAEYLRMRFVPIAIRQPAETLAEMEMDHAGPTGRTMWSNVVAPALGMLPLPNKA
ncbi:hypothetical protein OSJ57_17165 [Sphingomonas sp. HH69]